MTKKHLFVNSACNPITREYYDINTFKRGIKINEQLLTQGLGFPPQHQNQQPGIESQMNPLPISIDEHYLSSGKLKNKVALITGGDSGIGRAVAVAFAHEGANVVIAYLNEHNDGAVSKRGVEQAGQQLLNISGRLVLHHFL